MIPDTPQGCGGRQWVPSRQPEPQGGSLGQVSPSIWAGERSRPAHRVGSRVQVFGLRFKCQVLGTPG